MMMLPRRYVPGFVTGAKVPRQGKKEVHEVLDAGRREWICRIGMTGAVPGCCTERKFIAPKERVGRYNYLS